jgi:hypothetical protein
MITLLTSGVKKNFSAWRRVVSAMVKEVVVLLLLLLLFKPVYNRVSFPQSLNLLFRISLEKRRLFKRARKKKDSKLSKVLSKRSLTLPRLGPFNR